MDRAEPSFRYRVESIVAQIPPGRVMSYGQIAALCGNGRAARIVGGIAHFGDPTLPWHRVVSKNGGMASGYPGGKTAHASALADEGIEACEYVICDFARYVWRPSL